MMKWLLMVTCVNFLGKKKRLPKVRRMRDIHIVMSHLTLTLILTLICWIMNQRKERKSQYRWVSGEGKKKYNQNLTGVEMIRIIQNHLTGTEKKMLPNHSGDVKIRAHQNHQLIGDRTRTIQNLIGASVFILQHTDLLMKRKVS